MKNWGGHLTQLPFELIFWLAALTALWCLDPSESHSSLCPLHNLGFTWCPGCGLGRSISLLMDGEFTASWNLHPLGGFALTVILYRIVEIIKHIKKHNYGECTKASS